MKTMATPVYLFKSGSRPVAGISAWVEASTLMLILLGMAGISIADWYGSRPHPAAHMWHVHPFFLVALALVSLPGYLYFSTVRGVRYPLAIVATLGWGFGAYWFVSHMAWADRTWAFGIALALAALAGTEKYFHLRKPRRLRAAPRS